MFKVIKQLFRKQVIFSRYSIMFTKLLHLNAIVTEQVQVPLSVDEYLS